MIKTKKETKMFILGMTYISLMIVIGINFVSQSRAYFDDVLVVKPEVIIQKVEVEKPTPTEPTMRDWVKQEIESAGLDWEIVNCLIKNESGWNNWTYGVNTNGSTDMGLWQINSIHKKTASVECRWNYKCATHWAIQKRLNVGHWNDWYGYINNCK